MHMYDHSIEEQHHPIQWKAPTTFLLYSRSQPFQNLGVHWAVSVFTLITEYNVYFCCNMLCHIQNFKLCVNNMILYYSALCTFYNNIFMKKNNIFMKFTSTNACCCHPLVLLSCSIPLYGNTIWSHSPAGYLSCFQVSATIDNVLRNNS